jgi:hypothetical protein
VGGNEKKYSGNLMERKRGRAGKITNRETL